ncbi:aspartyl-tRNA(Asn)/glutamyl-tRNA(Gln) amidotransferase subunit A [Bhargavaea ginsengi]|uniref:Aspartyl-tRNA(Asn)/glutamyl-tRNA(Gln) amidotransferase subunit A n=2 Tax=Bhargavaea ginsengi TaxID=426757 RepID=A0A1H6U8I1_9BACL|nr:aspartyl-tRNA(Asn)/glutamyl-tRNA(Gln) amidotransferase subunit A [Bhargavaea ginsengi]
MNMMDAIRSIREREKSPIELVNETLETIRKKDPELNAYITVCEEEAVREAEQLTREWEAGTVRGPLHGIPIAVKDLVFTKEILTTMGSSIHQDFIPSEDATVIEKLKDAGAVIIGKTNTHEFAYGPTGDVSHFGPVQNPYDPSKISGGSSSGSAAAVASGMALAGIGTDTGGSVRIPASACNLVGMKPTFGRISKHNIFPLAYTLDHPGPITAGVEENAILLNILSGPDPADRYSLLESPPDFTEELRDGVEGKVIGLPSQYFRLLDPEVRTAAESAARKFEALGARVIEVDIPVMSEINDAQIVTIQCEAAAIHRKTMESRPGDYAPEVLARLEASVRRPGWEYVRAQQERPRLIEAFNEVFSKADVLLTPTLPILPTPIGERKTIVDGKEIDVIPALLSLTSPTNFTGNPSLGLPAGFSRNGLPIGIQLIGNHGDESKLYRFGYAFEQN